MVKKCILFSVLFIAIRASTSVFSQVVIYPNTTDQIYFGPKNVYPISTAICDDYIDYLHDVLIDEADFHDKSYNDFIGDIDLLISQWQSALVSIDSMVNLTNDCYHYTWVDQVIEEENLDLVVKDLPSYTSVTEYIDGINGAYWWRKTSDKNCKSDNPDECVVWCLYPGRNYSFNKSSYDSKYFINTIGMNSIIRKSEHGYVNNRFYRQVELEIQPAPTYSILNYDLDMEFSIFEIEKRACN